MSDPPFDEIEMTHAEEAKAAREFNQVYGAALAAWSSLEGQLFYWFQAVTRLDEKTARAVFFSARSFNGRADMLDAVLVAAEIDAPLRDFLDAALRKAWACSGFRNAATHGEPHLNLQRGSPTAKQLVIIQGRKMSHEAEASMITMQDLITATINFKRLGGFLFAARPDQKGSRPPAWLETHQQQVHELPSLPQSIEPNRKPSKPKGPRRS